MVSNGRKSGRISKHKRRTAVCIVNGIKGDGICNLDEIAKRAINSPQIAKLLPCFSIFKTPI